MTFHDLFINENIDALLHVWVDINRTEIIVVDKGSRSNGGYHVHHTDYVKQKPSQFGLEPEDVLDAMNVRDEKLLQSVIEKGYVRGTLDPTNNSAGLEGANLKSVYKALRMIMKIYSFYPDKLYIDMGNMASPNPDDAKHYELKGQRLEIFLKSGNLTQSRLMIENVARQKYQFWKTCVNFDDYEVPELMDMIDQSVEISYNTLMKNVGAREVASVFPDYSWGSSKGLTLKRDYHVRYYKSKYDGAPVYFIVHSATEFIFVPIGNPKFSN